MKSLFSLLVRAEERLAFQKVIFHIIMHNFCFAIVACFKVNRFVVSKVTRAMAKYGPAKLVAVSGCKVKVGT